MDSLLKSRLVALKEENASLHKEIESLKSKIASSSAKGLDAEFAEINGIHFLAKIIDGAERNDLMKLGDNLKTKHPDSLLLLIGKAEKGNSLVAFATGKAVGKLGASGAVKIAAGAMQGSGGGRAEMAQGSAKDLSRFDEAKKQIESALQ